MVDLVSPALPAPGILATVTFGKAFANALYAVKLQAGDLNAGSNLPLSFANRTTTGFDIVALLAPPASDNFEISYEVVALV